MLRLVLPKGRVCTTPISHETVPDARLKVVLQLDCSSSLLGVGRRKRSNWLSIRAIPDAQDAVLTAGNDDLAVGRDCGGFHEIGRAGKRTDISAIFANQTHFGVAGRGQSLVGVSDEADRRVLFVEAGDVLLLLAVHEIPDFDHVVRAGAGQRALVPVPTDAQHVVGVSLELLHYFARGYLD